MNATTTCEPIVLWAGTASDLMTANPVSIRADAQVKEAAELFTRKGFSAAPVIDEGGRPIGVVSQADVVTHQCEMVNRTAANGNQHQEALSSGAVVAKRKKRAQSPAMDRARVRDIMTPAIFAVPAHATAERVVEEMLALQVHRLFVIGKDGVLMGVISAIDILRRLRPKARTLASPVASDDDVVQEP